VQVEVIFIAKIRVAESISRTLTMRIEFEIAIIIIMSMKKYFS